MSEQRQLDLLGRLIERSALHAGLYSIALRQLDVTASVGEESARVSVICHCLRELMLGAPDILVDTPEPRPDPSSSALAESMPDVLAGNGSPDLRLDQDLIPVPREIAAAFADLIDASSRERGRNQRNAASLVTGSADGSHPSIAEWRKAYRFFVKWAHVDQHHSGTLPEDDAIIGHLRVVEDVIAVRVNLFFDNLAAVEDLLALANSTDEVEK